MNQQSMNFDSAGIQFKDKRDQHPTKRTKGSPFIVKVQNPPGSNLVTSMAPMMIYDRSRKTDCMASPATMKGGRDAYCQLFGVVHQCGCGGEKMGVTHGLKAYLKAYYTESGLLRILTDQVEPPQKW